MTFSKALKSHLQRFSEGEYEAAKDIEAEARRLGQNVQFVVTGRILTQFGTAPFKRSGQRASHIGFALERMVSQGDGSPVSIRVSVGNFTTKHDGNNQAYRIPDRKNLTASLPRSVCADLLRDAYESKKQRDEVLRTAREARLKKEAEARAHKRKMARLARYATADHIRLECPDDIHFFWTFQKKDAIALARKLAEKYGREHVRLRLFSKHFEEARR